MKRSFYLVALVLCLFGNVACADFLDTLLGTNTAFKTATASKSLTIYDTQTEASGKVIVLDDVHYRRRLNDLTVELGTTDWTTKVGKTKGDVESEIDSTKYALYLVELQVTKYVNYRRGLIAAFRYALPNLDELINKYATEFFK
ncbi:MAG: hypothetical protein LBD19_01975 [Endomicrobium sp.]|jgi:hypothetical protein|nr:hypothetical protein [Endomicrobium sp.]